MPASWYYARNNERFGPFSTDQLRRLAKAGKLLPSDMLLQVDTNKWISASCVSELTFAEARWYCAKKDKTFGPYTFEELKDLAVSGRLRPTDHARKENTSEWLRAEDVPALFPQRERRAAAAVIPVFPPPPKPIAVVPPPAPPKPGPAVQIVANPAPLPVAVRSAPIAVEPIPVEPLPVAAFPVEPPPLPQPMLAQLSLLPDPIYLAALPIEPPPLPPSPESQMPFLSSLRLHPLALVAGTVAAGFVTLSCAGLLFLGSHFGTDSSLGTSSVTRANQPKLRLFEELVVQLKKDSADGKVLLSEASRKLCKDFTKMPFVVAEHREEAREIVRLYKREMHDKMGGGLILQEVAEHVTRIAAQCLTSEELVKEFPELFR